jgi:uncharacterized protein YfiM (DUF2279 family)
MVSMNAVTLKRIIALGTLTGMRSMAGLAVLALPHPGVARPVMALAAAGEMVADKTALVGDRVDALPLAGRAVIGALVGALIAREEGQNAWLGGMVGSATALVAAHLAYHGRKGLPASSLTGGLLEDALVIAIGSRYA